MSKKVIELSKLAEPTIEEVLDNFLAEQQKRLSPKTFRLYKDVMRLLKNCLNGYAHQSLLGSELALFEKHFNAQGEGHREFCQIFGPDKIPAGLGEFLGYFMIRKVMAGEDLKRAAGTVTKKLCRWLSERGYISTDVAKTVAQESGRAGRDLQKAERAARIISTYAGRLSQDPSSIADQNYIEFEHFTISRVEPGKLWLEEYLGDGVFGPIPVPIEATDLLEQGGEISCSLGRIRGTWRILEMGNVYP